MIDKLLLSLGACQEARIWAKGKSWEEIFTTCHRGDWLLWLFAKTAPKNESNLKLITRAKTHCALTVRHLMKDERSINACEVALKFADGLASLGQVKSAYADAAYAAHAAYTAAANAAYAYDVADATDADYDAAHAAHAAANAAYAYDVAGATDAAYDAAYATKNQMETADICRKYLPIEVWNIVED